MTIDDIPEGAEFFRGLCWTFFAFWQVDGQWKFQGFSNDKSRYPYILGWGPVENSPSYEVDEYRNTRKPVTRDEVAWATADQDSLMVSEGL